MKCCQQETHNHPSNSAELESEKIVASIKQKAMETAQPIPTLYISEVHQVSAVETQCSIKFVNVKAYQCERLVLKGFVFLMGFPSLQALQF